MELRINWLGHSCFRIQADSYTVLIDPYSPDTVPGLKPLKESADLVLFSHDHPDHHGVHGIGLRTTQENPFTIQKIDSFHDTKQGKVHGRNKIHVLQVEDFKLVHMGDLGCDLTLFQYGLLRDADVLMIPVGGGYSLDAHMANEMAKELKPMVTIPMHYRTANFGAKQLAMLEDYIREYEGVMKFYESSEVVITKDMEPQAAILYPKYAAPPKKPAEQPAEEPAEAPEEEAGKAPDGAAE